MQINSISNSAIGNKQADREFQTKGADTEQHIDKCNIIQFWNQLNSKEREEILLLKDHHIIERVSQSLNDYSFVSCVNSQYNSSEAITRTVICKRKEKPNMIISISELERLDL